MKFFHLSNSLHVYKSVNHTNIFYSLSKCSFVLDLQWRSVVTYFFFLGGHLQKGESMILRTNKGKKSVHDISAGVSLLSLYSHIVLFFVFWSEFQAILKYTIYHISASLVLSYLFECFPYDLKSN